jgi:alkaline phosphatase
MISHLKSQNIQYIKENIVDFRNLKHEKAWTLFGAEAFPYDIDRDKKSLPSLEEMTIKALSILSQNENGFFLMVEGSRIDFAAHDNDAIACITDFIAFDNAVGAAMEFALKDGNTTVIIMPDHGNSGFTIGEYNLEKYTTASLEELFGQVSKYKKSAEGIAQILKNEKSDNYKAIIKKYTDLEITDEEKNYLLDSINSRYINAHIAKIMNVRTHFGFTTFGHTGEDVFLAAYHPQGDLPIGMNTNIEINHYISDVLDLQTKLPELTAKIFAKHSEVFAGFETTIDKSGDFPVLIVKNNDNILEIPAHKSVAYLNGQLFDIGSVTVYIDINETFYLSEKLKEKI